MKVGKAKPKLFSGFWKYIGQRDLNVFFPFSRLACINGEYLDRFVDPLISLSEMEYSDFFILDPPNFMGEYKRLHKANTIANEGRTVFRQSLKYWYKIVTPVVYGKRIKRMYDKCKSVFHLDVSCLSYYMNVASTFLASYAYYHFWFKILKPRRVFVVFREAYFPQIAVCKRLGIPVAEFQHGITMGDTVSFTGDYDSRIDPDYFLAFGEFWKGPQFGMPIDRIFCVGWAYKDLIAKKIGSDVEKNVGRILVISSPEITDAVIDALSELSKTEKNYGFDIRLHPCEMLSEKQKYKLKKETNAQIVDNKIDSAIALMSYRYVVGENSSVIYEALSLGCKVGMLNLGGLRPPIDRPGIKENFFVINDVNDFERFLGEENQQSTTKAEFYSDFDNEKFMNFVNDKM